MASPKRTMPPQHQETQPSVESKMNPKSQKEKDNYHASGKLTGKIAIITGGDSGISSAVAVHFAKEGADVAIVYLEEHKDAEDTKARIEQEGRNALLIAGDVGNPEFCNSAVRRTIKAFDHLDIVVNNAAFQLPQETIEDISNKQLEKTFRTNIFSYFYLTRAAIKHLHAGASIINTTSVTAYRGSPALLDYSSTKGAIVSFTRSLSLMLVKRKIRVNGVAPGPIWTPLTPSSYSKKKVESFGANTPMERPGQPAEVAPAYVFLASSDASYINGQVIHVNGGEIING